MALRRPYIIDNINYLPAPTGGWNPDGNPWELPQTQAPVLDNALMRPGRVVVRGALTNWADLSAITTPAAPLNVVGVQPVPGSTKLAIGRKAISATAFVDPWFAPLVRPPAASALAAPTADIAVVVGGTTFTNVANAANLIPGPRGIDFEGTRYFIGYGTFTSPTLDSGNTYYAQTTNLCTLSTAGAPTPLDNAPRGFIDIKGWQSRIWGLGGIDDPAGGGGGFDALTLFYSNPLGPGGGNGTVNACSGATGVPYADWKDCITGFTNKVTMDGDTTDPGVGLAANRNGLIVFRRNSIWLLRGSTPASYALTLVSQQVGCVDPRSIVETDKGVYFLSDQGLMLTDGVSVVSASGPVMHTIQSAVTVFVAAVQSSFGGYATAAVTSAGQIVVSIGASSATGGAPDGHIQPIWAGMYDPSTAAWIRITSALFAVDASIISPGNNYPGWVINTPDNRLLSVGDKYVTQWEAQTSSTTLTPQLTSLYAPTVANDASAGTVPWTNPADAEGSGTSPYAQVASSAAGTVDSEYLKATGFAFNIPTNATINGVLAAIQRGNGVSLAGNTVEDAAVHLVKGGTIQTTNKALAGAWPGFVQDVIYGGPSDLWGIALTPADVNASNFGFVLSAELDRNAGAGQAIAVVQAMTITVYYTIANVTKQQSFIKVPALYDIDAAGNFQPIPFRWLTQLFPVIGTSQGRRNVVQLKRWIADYVFQGTSLPSTNGFTVKPVDSGGVQIAGAVPVQLPPSQRMVSSSVSGGPLNANPVITRASTYLDSEVTDMAFDITWTDAQQALAPGYVAVEVYGVGIEMIPGRDLTGS